jgi:uncharacterized repeat protein (TIGR02543 family)
MGQKGGNFKMKRANSLTILCMLSLLLLSPFDSSPQAIWFQNGQQADIILGPYANSGGASALHHPSRVCADSAGRLYVADTRNNRILIWNTIPTSNNAPADLVVGQPDMNSNDSGGGQTGLNWPVGVYSDGTHLFVADSNNNRVLIWNSIPTQNRASADIVLGQPDFTSYEEPGGARAANTLSWPWDVFYDGQHLFVADSGEGRVLIWNSLPLTNNQAADVVVGKSDFTSSTESLDEKSLFSPRGGASNGTALAISDYKGGLRVLIWNNIPTQNGKSADVELLQPDFFNSPNDYSPLGVSLQGQKLYVACNHNVYVWNSLPTQNNQPPDCIIGRSDLQPGLSAEALSKPWGASSDGARLYVADTNNSRVLIYNQIPTASDIDANVVLGQADFGSCVFRSKNGIRSVSGVASTGHHLLLATHVDSRIVIHDGLPEQDCAEADYIISDVDFDEPPGQFLQLSEVYQCCQMWTDGSRLFAAELYRGILVWDKFPQTSFTNPDTEILHTQGVALNQPQGVASDGTRLFVSDSGNNRVLIWNTIPKKDGTAADVVLGQSDFNSGSPGLMNYPSRIATDGQRLAVADMENHRILIWNSIPTQNNQPPDIKLFDFYPGRNLPWRFNGPQGVFIFDSHLFVTDLGFNRVLIWNTFPAYDDQPADVVLGQPDFTTARPGKARDKLYSPLNIWFDGEYLWVGEFKFADRALGYRANIAAVAPEAPNNLSATAKSAHQIDLAWMDNASNEQGFKLERKSGASGTYEQIAYLSANTRKYSEIRLTAGTQYYYQMKAYNRYGDSAFSSEASASTSATNNPPNTPSNPSPANSQTEVSDNPVFSWDGGDLDEGDVVTYDVYLDTVNPPTFRAASNLSKTTYSPSTLSLKTIHYWKVVAKDLSGALTEGPVWSFQTKTLSGYTLTIQASSGGTTFPRPGTPAFEPGNSVSVYAIPDNNYSFSGWTGDVPAGHEKDNPLTLTMNSDKSLKANFSSTIVKYTLTIASSSGGTTDPSPGNYTYDSGTSVSVKAIANSGYSFSGWSGDASGTTNPLTVTMDGNKSITANFSASKGGDDTSSGKKGGCFIATASYGSSLHSHVKILRDFRDEFLMPYKLGRILVRLYYRCSPPVADFIAKRKALKLVVRITLLPFVGLSYLMLRAHPTIPVAILTFFAASAFIVRRYRKKR